MATKEKTTDATNANETDAAQAPAAAIEAAPAAEPSPAAKIVLAWLQSFNGSAIAANTECYNLLHAKSHELVEQLDAGVK